MKENFWKLGPIYVIVPVLSGILIYCEANHIVIDKNRVEKQ